MGKICIQGKLKIVKFYVNFYVVKFYDDFSHVLNIKSIMFCILLLKVLILV